MKLRLAYLSDSHDVLLSDSSDISELQRQVTNCTGLPADRQLLKRVQETYGRPSASGSNSNSHHGVNTNLPSSRRGVVIDGEATQSRHGGFVSLQELGIGNMDTIYIEERSSSTATAGTPAGVLAAASGSGSSSAASASGSAPATCSGTAVSRQSANAERLHRNNNSKSNNTNNSSNNNNNNNNNNEADSNSITRTSDNRDFHVGHPDVVRGPAGTSPNNNVSNRADVPVGNSHLREDATSTSGHPIAAEFVERSMRYEVRSDNSCLFACINFLVCNNTFQISELRHMISDHIRGNPSYTDVMLDKPREEYMRWICEPDSWGGYLELIIFAEILEVNIAVYDIASERLDLYGEHHPRRIYLLYDGVHYDCVVAETSLPGSPMAKMFLPWDELSQAKVSTLVADLHRTRKFISSSGSGLKVRCAVCEEAFRDTKAATEHATRTGHSSFREIG